ncbi:MAG: DNA adenine methylase [Acidimicrobiaceae bacterium]|nr:DNA adenine methylase [Acidimicrobiaceae bacterium]
MEKASAMLQPFQYQGSKRLIASEILKQLQLSSNSELVEPFAGSAAVSVRAAIERRAGHYWINDKNEPLSDLWREIVEEPHRLAYDYSQLWRAQKSDPRGFYTEIRDRFNQRHRPADLLYLLSRAVKGAVRYNSEGYFNQSPDNRRLGTQPHILAKRITAISKAMKGRTRITSMDYRAIPELYEEGQIWYMDPPYQGVSSTRDSRYACTVVRSEFERFLRVLIDMQIPFVLSYDGHTGTKTYGPPLPPELGLRRMELDAGRSTAATLLGRTDRTTEVLYISPRLIDDTSNAAVAIEQLALISV